MANEKSRENTAQWQDVHRLLKDLRADGYGVDDISTDTSAPTPTKIVTIEVKR